MPSSYIKKILEARVYDVAVETPLDTASMLSKRLNNQVLLKREDLQPVFSFKIRGAYNKMSGLSAKAKERGVITVSAGNHAQGVALAAKTLNIKATIVMPNTTPDIKVTSVRERGGKIILHGDTYDEAAAYAMKLAKKDQLTFIPPFDDPDVIAGQGTIGMEILRQHRGHIDAVFVPVGGGGLIAGVGAFIKYLSPKTKVIGVEPDDAETLHSALKAKRRVKLERVGTFADGVAVKEIGKETFRVAQACVDEVILVNVDEICAAIKDIYEDTRSVTEPSGALAVAGLKKYVEKRRCQNKTLVAIDSGANVNFDRLAHIAERAEVGEGKEAILAVTIPERPGSFKSFCHTLGKRMITEFNYRYADEKRAHIFVGVQLKSGAKERQALVKQLKDKKYPVTDITENDLAKLHIRHMVGGTSPGLEDEVVFRFQFPERPGALLDFLNALGQRWNISMFHYRNHGSAYGRVLVGIQVPQSERKVIQGYLDELGYPYWEETDNTAYQLFLK